MTDKMDITHAFGWQLDKGMKRPNNEDSLAAVKVKQANEEDVRSLGIYAVADGIGGEAGGAKASKLAIETAMSEMLTHIHDEATGEEVKAWLANAAILAHKLILRLKQSPDETVVGGTTLTMAAVVENQVHIANIGDSRAYIIRDGQLRQITNDHTVAQRFVDEGIITPEQAIDHPYSHVLSQAIGGNAELEPDVFTETVNPGEFILLCSDGLYNLVSAKDIVEIVRDAESPTQASQQLTQAANAAGGSDNIAVIVVAIHQRD
jgi:PPM family protein phosphatase